MYICVKCIVMDVKKRNKLDIKKLRKDKQKQVDDGKIIRKDG